MLLTNATVIDGTGRAPLERASVRIEGGRIVEVGSVGADGTVPDGALDLGGRTLMPGLIDAHAHLSSDVFRVAGVRAARGAARRAAAAARARLLHPRQDRPRPAGRRHHHRP